MKAIAYLGPPGTFSHEAAVAWARRVDRNWQAGADTFLACPNLPEVMTAVQNHQAGAGILPVENSIEGAVNLTLDLVLEEEGLQVIGEVVLPVCHCLMGQAEDMKAIREVWSHPQALAQCRHYLATNLPGAKLKAVTSTAEAAREARRMPELAAIASAFAARLYQLPVLATSIQDYQENKTRFWVLGREAPSLPGPYKTSLVVAALANRPGSLYAILKDFAEAGINLTRIESRPTKKELGEYLFFIDCEGKATAPPLKEVLAGLKSRTGLLKILGSYSQDRGETSCS
ncbi:Prephenate dehydratase [Neomoorella glycerini]|uniref:Prephenate dehydratase n=1 Tax=Neomoorella glycerini TaxID=55779 RepID=A0A6I5ZUK5_9FIRM|nr:prephenate dehydratase [Moorella glycerini]QGP93713.1 Prephenate dehydratase [Moorella glycerini]